MEVDTADTAVDTVVDMAVDIPEVLDTEVIAATAAMVMVNMHSPSFFTELRRHFYLNTKKKQKKNFYFNINLRLVIKHLTREH